MMTKPGFGQGEFFQTRASQLLGGLGGALSGLNSAFGGIPGNYYSRYRQGSPSIPATAQDTGMYGRYVPGSQQQSFSSTPSAAERAYQQEASRVAQLTAQDPELQRYEAARLKAVAPGATPEAVQTAEDIGMQMWAKANPTLAAKVKPGQSGYDAIRGVVAGNAARSGFGFTTPQQLLTTPPPGVESPQGLPAVTSFGTTQAFGPNAVNLDPELLKKFQGLINQANI
jgi:hypothetical protein